MASDEPIQIEEKDTIVICWISDSKGYVFDVASEFKSPTLIYSHTVVEGERKDMRPPRRVVRKLRNDYGYHLR